MVFDHSDQHNISGGIDDIKFDDVGAFLLFHSLNNKRFSIWQWSELNIAYEWRDVTSDNLAPKSTEAGGNFNEKIVAGSMHPFWCIYFGALFVVPLSKEPLLSFTLCF